MRTPLFAVLTLLASSASLVIADPLPDAGTQVYQKLVHSTVWIHSNRGTSLATGSGSLIDARRRLVLTNYHVVGEVEQATVLFPVFREDRPIAEREYYTKRIRDLGIRGKVIARDRSRDLAIIQLEKLGPSAKALNLAERSVAPGQTVHSVGNPGDSGALWVYTPGKVRQVYQKHWRVMLDGREAQFQAEVVETDSATNAGDSGGPLVNDQGELVAVTQGGALKANLLSTFIDISEVKKFLATPEIRKLVAADVEPSKRTSAIASRDEAKFFSSTALDAANAAAKSIYRKNSCDLVIETYTTAPLAMIPEVKAMSAAERQKFMSEWAASRVKAEGINGVYLLICKEPSSLDVKVSSDPALKLHADDAKKLRDAILEKFRVKKYDDGLEAFVKLANEMLNK